MEGGGERRRSPGANPSGGAPGPLSADSPTWERAVAGTCPLRHKGGSGRKALAGERRDGLEDGPWAFTLRVKNETIQLEGTSGPSFPGQPERGEWKLNEILFRCIFVCLLNHSHDLKILYPWISNGFGYIHRQFSYKFPNYFPKKDLLANATKCNWSWGFCFYLSCQFCSLLDLILISAWQFGFKWKWDYLLVFLSKDDYVSHYLDSVSHTHTHTLGVFPHHPAGMLKITLTIL